MTPVERMARAIGKTVDGRTEASHLTPWTMLAASEALKAIREPSKAMIEAGSLAFAEAAFECGKPSKEALRHAWQVMIDKALSET